MDVLDIEKKLVSIPSFVDESNNEVELANWISSYLKNFNFLEVRKQKVERDRFNVFAQSKSESKILFAAHMDTVEPKEGGKYNPLEPNIEKDKLFGLGALDTKACIASMLACLDNFKDLNNADFLFYCDEEYSFKGMRRFLSEAGEKDNSWNLAIVGEPSHLKIMNAHRGLLEVEFAIKGKSGHAARPKEGNNANEALMRIFRSTKQKIKKYKHEKLGTPSVNIAFMRGGLLKDRKDNGEIILGDQGNNIPDYAKAKLDIRTTTENLRAQEVKDIIEEQCQKEEVGLFNFSINHDLGSLYTDPSKIEVVKETFKKNNLPLEYQDPSQRGYGDGQMIKERLEIPTVYLGAKGKGMHSAGEWVSIQSLEKLTSLYTNIIDSK
ncbi:MAG: M20 family metallopeptidase [Candidatus Magasanikbacteria bacterium]